MQSLFSLRLVRALPRAFTRPYSFAPGPSPPKLPASEQAEFERLQRQASVSAAFQPERGPAQQTQATKSTSISQTDNDALHPGMFRGAPPEFNGDTNPKTGEVGGPKNEPLRWGGEGDWSYNGRVTDF